MTTPAPHDPLEGIASSAHAPPASAGTVAHGEYTPPGKKEPPKRYTAAGVGFLLAFMVLTAVLTARQQQGLAGFLVRSAPGVSDSSGEGSSDLPRESRATLARVAKDAAEFECLANFNWDRPDGACRERVLPIAESFGDHLGPLSRIDTSKDEELLELVRNIADFRQNAQAITIIEAAPGPAPMNVEAMIRRTVLQARSIVTEIDELIGEDERKRVGDPIATGLTVMTGQDPTGQVELMEDPDPDDDDAPAPAPTPVAAPAATPDAPVAAAPVVAAAPPPAGSGPSPESLIAPVREALQILEGCPRSQYDVPDCVARARTSLAAADDQLGQYRSAHPDAAGVAFARLVDAAVGRTRRASVEMSSAAQLAGAHGPDDSIGGNPFRNAEGQLKEAAGAIETAAGAAATAPH